jgi:type II secretory pathway component PulJ
MRKPVVVTLLASLLLGACATVVPLQRAQLASLSRDSRPAEIEAAIGQATAKWSFNLDHAGRSHAVRVFDLRVGSSTQMMTICTPNCFIVPTQVPVNATFVLVQGAESKQLLAWGTLEELAKDADPAVSGLAAPVRERIAALEKAK